MRVIRYTKTLFLLCAIGIILLHSLILLDNIQLSEPINAQMRNSKSNFKHLESKFPVYSDQNKHMETRIRDKNNTYDITYSSIISRTLQGQKETDTEAESSFSTGAREVLTLGYTLQPQRIVSKDKISTDSSNVPNAYISDINSIEDMKRYVANLNKAQHIHNSDSFIFPKADHSTVIVIQVHNRTEYLKILIDSFAKASYIENNLLIFSHDFFNVEINQIISQIDFCPVMQIYYPFSIQMFPDEFPGQDPKDCPRDMKANTSSAVGCNNYLWHDTYGHYREATYTQIKHHWFWKLNHVFDGLSILNDFDGPVLLVEEDHMMVEDFNHVLHQMYHQEELCSDCDILSLGTYTKTPNYQKYSNKVDITHWLSSAHNMGMALTRQIWERIKTCAEAFCQFDDYNWDWSLQHISTSCLKSQLKVMFATSPRIFHIGECGLHHKGKKCDPTQRVKDIYSDLHARQQYLYPHQLQVKSSKSHVIKKRKVNGGWADKRDHKLCMSFVKPNATD